MTFQERIHTYSEQHGKGRIWALAIGLIVILVFIAVALYWVLRTPYQVLFNNLDGRDANAIVAELERLKVPYRLDEASQAILVPEQQVYKTRMQLMGKDLALKGAVGFELFNNQDYGMTDFAQRVAYQRAMQGELARTIMSFEEVKSARVHLVMPDPHPFRRSQVKPKASVSIALHSGNQLTQEQVVGIQRLVAAAVPGIEPGFVTVLDQRGVAMTKVAVPESSEISSVNIEQKKELENYLIKKAQEVLEKIYGAGQSMVRVDVTLGREQIRSTKEEILSASKIDGEAVGVITRRRVSDQQEGASGSGDTGTTNRSTQESGGRSRSSSQMDTDYLPGKLVEQTLINPGFIKRLSVAVVLPEAVDEDQLQKAKELVSSAVGAVNSRGDTITVYGIDEVKALPMTQSADTGLQLQKEQDISLDRSGAKTAKQLPAQQNLIIILLVVILLLMAVIAVVVFKKRNKPSTTAVDKEVALRDIKTWLAAGNEKSHG